MVIPHRDAAFCLIDGQALRGPPGPSGRFFFLFGERWLGAQERSNRAETKLELLCQFCVS
jgi:hypothetical protein